MIRTALALLVLLTAARAAEDLPEDLPRKPLWIHRLAERDPHLGPHMRYISQPNGWVPVTDRWGIRSRDRGAAPDPVRFGHASIDPYPAVSATQLDGFVFYKDYRFVVPRSRVTGRLEVLVSSRFIDFWNIDPSQVRSVGIFRPGVDLTHKGRRLEAVYRSLDYGGNGAVVTQHSIFVTESRKPPGSLTRRALASARESNTLIAYSRETGKTLWAWDPDLGSIFVWRNPDLKRKWLEDFHRHARVVFRGPGAVAGDVLYTLVDGRDPLDKPAGVSIWAIDTCTGVVLFRTKVRAPDDVLQQIPTDATLTVQNGVVYVYASGVVAAIDGKAPGQVFWRGSYERQIEDGGLVPKGPRRGVKSGRAVVPTFALHRPILTGGMLLVIAPDAKEIVAFRAGDGRRLWARPRSELQEVAHLVGIRYGVIVLAGTAVVGLDEKTGKTLWGPVALGERPYGRGYVGKRYAHVPSERGGIHRFEVATGKRAETLRFDTPRLGNLQYSDGLLIATGEDRVHCFGNRTQLLRRLEARAERADSDTLLDLALLRLGDEPDLKARRAVRGPLRLAVERAQGPLTKRHCRRYAFENLVALARAANELEPLAEAKRLTEERAYHAQIRLVRARILRRLGKEAESDEELRKMAREFSGVQVVLDEKVLPATEAASRLLSK